MIAWALWIGCFCLAYSVVSYLLIADLWGDSADHYEEEDNLDF